MKILFLVGCVEPGRDGVGDYTRMLAQHCEALGHECRIASLYDSYILDAPEISRFVWRYSNALADQNEKNSLLQLSEEFNPDWVSLQFVPYAFNPKGLPLKLPLFVSQIAPDAKFHIMFHETWTGPHTGASIRDRTYGFLQKILLKRLTKIRAPDCTHTHASPYMHILKQLGLQSKKLPLFSNIPITASNADAWLFDAISREGIPINQSSREQYILLGIFGSLYPEWPIKKFSDTIKKLAKKCNKRCILITIGHTGNNSPYWNRIREESGKTLSLIQLGHLSPLKVSEVLQSLDWGVATLPWSLIEKGSSVATLLAHGLPTIVPRDDIHFNFKYSNPTTPGLIKLDDLSEENFKRPPKRPPHDPGKEIALSFLSNLQP